MIPSPLSKQTQFFWLINQQLTPIALFVGRQVLPKENTLKARQYTKSVDADADKAWKIKSAYHCPNRQISNVKVLLHK